MCCLEGEWVGGGLRGAWNGLLCSRLSTRHSVLTYTTLGRVCTVAPFSRWGNRLRGESSLFCKNKKWRVHYFVKTKNSLGLYSITCYLFLITQSSAFHTNVCMCVGITWDLVKGRFWFSKSEVGPGCSSRWSGAMFECQGHGPSICCLLFLATGRKGI